MMKYINLILIPVIFIFSCAASINSSKDNLKVTQPVAIVTHSNDTIEPKFTDEFVLELNEPAGNLESVNLVATYTTTELQHFFKRDVCHKLKKNVCQYNLNSFKSSADFGDFDLESNPIINNKAHVDSVKGYKIEYTTIDLHKKRHLVSGAVLIPNNLTHLKGVVLFFHPTIIEPDLAPSNFFSSDQYGKLLGGIFAAQGYIVIMPDYLGLGDDTTDIHPYILYPKVNALSGAFMLKALNDLLLKEYSIKLNNVGVYPIGFSEGGAYSLWFSRLMQESMGFLTHHGYQLRKTIAMDGAYNLSKVSVPYLLDNIRSEDASKNKYLVNSSLMAAIAKPTLAGYTLSSYAVYDLNKNFNLAFNPKFFNCKNCVINKKHYNLYQVFQLKSNYRFNLIKNLYNNATSLGYGWLNNSGSILVHNKLLYSDKFKNYIASRDIYNWHSSYPVTLVTLANDSIVSPLNTFTAYESMGAMGSYDLKEIVVNNSSFQVAGLLPFIDVNLDHAAAMPYLLVVARNEIKDN